VFLRQSPTMLATGPQTSHKLALPLWDFLTWAAKPSVRKSQPRNDSETYPANSALSAHVYLYVSNPRLVP
jgi:hypothetical protein